jgi:hypothetical protein
MALEMSKRPIQIVESFKHADKRRSRSLDSQRWGWGGGGEGGEPIYFYHHAASMTLYLH